MRVFKNGLIAVMWVLGATSAGIAQSAPPVTFDVASIRHIENTEQIRSEVRAGTRRPGMVITDTRVTITYMSLAEILRRAFRVEPYGLSGPDWLNDLRFDIHATIPAGGTREQVPAMLQALLRQRFDLVTRRETRQVSGYVLVTKGDTVKLREVPSDPEGRADACGDTAKPDPGTMKTDTSPLRFKGAPDGALQADICGMPMSELARELTPAVSRPVVDRTGLSGRYQFTLQMSSEDMAPLRPAGSAGAPAGPPVSASDPRGPLSGMVNAVERIGLKLEPRTVPLDVIVIDRVSRTATPN